MRLELGDRETGTVAAEELLRSEQVSVCYHRDAAGAAEAVAQLAEPPRLLGVDIETEPLAEYANHHRAGLDPHMSRIRLFQAYGGGDTAHVFDLRSVPLGVLEPLWKLPLVAHNALFELEHLLHAGVRPERIGCTMLQANALSGGLPSLADLARDRLGWAISKDLQLSDWGAAELRDEQLEYAALDAVVALRIAQAQQHDLEAEQKVLTYRLMRDAQHTVARTELAGFGFDAEHHDRVIEHWRHALTAAEQTLTEILGPSVSPDSGKQIADWLEQRLEPATLAHWPRTGTGRLRTNAMTLARYPDHPLVAPLLRHRDAATRLATFGPSFAEHVSPVTGRIHARFRLGAAASGRMACFDPNLQSIPRDPAFRALFAAPGGRVLVVADYAQIELRVAAIVAGDAAMLAAYREGQDLHRMTAAAITKLGPHHIDDEQRRLAKAVNFGLLYGQGPRGLAAYSKSSYGVEMTENEARRARDAFFISYHGLAVWQQETARHGESAGRVETPCGRVFDFRRTRHGFSYTEALNIPIQGGAAEVLMAALAHLDRELAPFDAEPVNIVHDELVVECAEDEDAQVRAALERTMTAGLLDVFPDAPTEGLVEASSGHTWADAK